MTKDKDWKETQKEILERIDELEAKLAKCVDLSDTGLKDKNGKNIMAGNVVHWSDGGDDLPCIQRLQSRWDRIAVVERPNASTTFFRVIDSQNKYTKERGNIFNYGNFIYKETHKYLTVLADSQDEYREKYPTVVHALLAVWRSDMPVDAAIAQYKEKV